MGGWILQAVPRVILVAGLLLHGAAGSAAEHDEADHCSAPDSVVEQQPWKGVQLLQQDSKRTSTGSERPSSDGEVPVAVNGLALSQGLFPITCRSRLEKFEFATHVALHCGAALGKVWTCMNALNNPFK